LHLLAGVHTPPADQHGLSGRHHDNHVALEQASLAIAVIVVAAILAAGCDTFFTLDATVTDCTTRAPLAGVTAVLHLDDGFGEEDHTQVTGEDGKIHVVMNEPDSVTATLTLSKDGFQTLSRTFAGNPPGPVEICLDPAGP
jgi:hypothetical protein